MFKTPVGYDAEQASKGLSQQESEGVCRVHTCMKTVQLSLLRSGTSVVNIAMK